MIQGKSPTAYVAPALAGALLLGLIVAMLATGEAHPGLLALCFGATVGAGHRLLVLQTYRVWFDDSGVWECHGLLPAARRCRGIRWRDAGRVMWRPSSFGWPRHCGAVHIHHRTFKGGDLCCSHLIGGEAFVAALNRERQHQVASITLATGPRSRPGPVSGSMTGQARAKAASRRRAGGGVTT